MTKTGWKNHNQHCLARKRVILKSLKKLQVLFLAVQQYLHYKGSFCLWCIVEDKSEEKKWLIKENSVISQYCQCTNQPSGSVVTASCIGAFE